MNDYRILVVDDEEDLCEILKFNLEMEGYTVDTANSAEEALKLDLTSYNLLLLDVMMGEISGFKMASMLKKNKDTAGIPIIFIRRRTKIRQESPLFSLQPKIQRTTLSPALIWEQTIISPNRFHCVKSSCG